MIPKLLHFIWMQGLRAMPDRYRRCLETWESKHPDWEVKLWTRENLLPLVNDWVLEIDNPTVQADIVRVEMVYALGGVYMDMDMECLRPLDDLLYGLTAFASMRNKLVIENAGFGALQEHPWLQEMIEEFRRRRDRIGKVLDVDKPFGEVTRRHSEVKVFPLPVFHLSDSERDRLEHARAHAIHHRFGLWMKDDERYAERYARVG